MYRGPIIDCDVHHNRISDDELIPFLPVEWREYASRPDVAFRAPMPDISPPLGTNKRLDAYPDAGGPPGSDYRTLREQLLDPFNVERALLGFDVGEETAVPDPYFSHALAEALNRWTQEKWLDGTGDDRVCSPVIVATHVPEMAAEEIRRAAEHPKVITAYLAYNALGKPLGHPIYEPIYKAAAETGLPIHLHVTPGEFMGGGAPWIGGGPTQYRFDIYVGGSQPMPTHLTSMIMNGVFERYKDLKVLATEVGLAWLPWYFTAVDAQYELMKRDSRWVRRWPSEYLRERLFVSTQPCEAASPSDRGRLLSHLRAIDGIEEMLVFSSDYPHWDADAPTYIQTVLPKSWHDRVFHDNARRVLRLPRQTTDPRSAVVQSA